MESLVLPRAPGASGLTPRADGVQAGQRLVNTPLRFTEPTAAASWKGVETSCVPGVQRSKCSADMPAFMQVPEVQRYQGRNRPQWDWITRKPRFHRTACMEDTATSVDAPAWFTNPYMVERRMQAPAHKVLRHSHGVMLALQEDGIDWEVQGAQHDKPELGCTMTHNRQYGPGRHQTSRTRPPHRRRTSLHKLSSSAIGPLEPLETRRSATAPAQATRGFPGETPRQSLRTPHPALPRATASNAKRTRHPARRQREPSLGLRDTRGLETSQFARLDCTGAHITALASARSSRQGLPPSQRQRRRGR